jgi:hypothetical protein
MSMKLMRISAASTEEGLKVPPLKNQGALRFNLLLASAAMTVVCAWIVLAETSPNASSDNSFGSGRTGCQLSGLVTLNGRPLSHGQIRLSCQMTPTEYSEDSPEPHPVSVPVIDGEYFVSESNRLVPGWYLVQILISEKPAPLADPYPMPVWCDPAQKAVRSKAGRRLMIQIAESSVQTVDFDLENESQPTYQDLH